MTGIRFFNTLTRNKEDFVPQSPGRVGMYTCGPTVYEYASIGNMRAYVFADILRRTLEYNGLEVNMVMNITDVGHLVSDADEGEDKMMISARRERKTPWEIVRHYTEVFLDDTKRLNIRPVTVLCYATQHIPEMIVMVQELADRGYAYETSDGVYFDISKFPEYGCLSRINLSEQKVEQGWRLTLRKGIRLTLPSGRKLRLSTLCSGRARGVWVIPVGILSVPPWGVNT